MSASDRDSVVLLSAGYYETAVVLAKRVCTARSCTTLAREPTPPTTGPPPPVHQLHKPASNQGG